jgi:protein-tyrosine phosphatase
MKHRQEKAILFLCTGNYYRSRFAEVFFNSVAGRMGLAWRAFSGGLALERGVNNVGPMAVEAVRALEAMGLSAADDFARSPAQVTADDLDNADWIVALKEAEHRPLLQERFPAWIEKVEFWHVDDAPGVLALIEREIVDLTARLIAGGKRRKAQEMAAEPVAPSIKKEVIKTSAGVVRLGRETKGRRGKGVTTVSDLPMDDAGLMELAAQLKQRCGSGGTVKDGRIEIQGDHRERLTAVLEGMGYRIKRVGG